MRRTTVGPGGTAASVSILIASACGAALCRNWGAGALLVVMGLLWAVRQPRVLRAVLSRSFLVFAAILAVSAYLANAGSPHDALRLALVMLARACTVVWAVAGLASSVSVEDMAALGSRLGMRGLGFAIGTAANSMTRSVADMRGVWWTIRMRRGGRPGLHDWRRFILTVLSRTVTRADEIALAAQARGVDPSAYDGSMVSVTRADWAWSFAAWMASALALGVDLVSAYWYH